MDVVVGSRGNGSQVNLVVEELMKWLEVNVMPLK